MITLPLIYFLYLFFGAMIIWLMVSLAGVFHLLSFGGQDKKAPMIAFVYVAVSLVMAVAFLNFYNATDWSAEISLSLPVSAGQQNIMEQYGN